MSSAPPAVSISVKGLSAGAWRVEMLVRHNGRARLVTEEPRGRHRYYHLAAEPLADVQDWLHPFERYWRNRLTALRDFVEGDQ